MSLGNFAGGMADGIGEGIKIRSEADKAKRARDEQLGKDRQKALMADIPVVGSERAADWTPEKHAESLVAGIKAPVTPIERIKNAVARRMRPQDAAASAGIQTTPIAAPAPEGGAAPAAGGIPTPAEGETAPIVVEPPKSRKVTDTDQLRYMIRAAVEGGDHAGAAQMYERLGKLQQRDLALDVERAAMRGMPGLANAYEKMHPGSVINYEDAGNGKYKITVDGDEWGVKSVDEVQDTLTEFALKDPGAAREASLVREDSRRKERDLLSNEQYRAGMLRLNQLKTEVDGVAARSTADLQGAQAGKIRFETKAQETKYNTTQALVGAAGNDANLDPEGFMKLATAVAMADPEGTSKVVTDENGVQKLVTVPHPVLAMAKAKVEADQLRFKTSPYANTTLGKGTEPILSTRPLGDRTYYRVLGVDAPFDNIDAAERAARRLYPPVPAKK